MNNEQKTEQALNEPQENGQDKYEMKNAITGSDLGNEVLNLVAEYGYLTSEEIQMYVGDRRKAFNIIGYLREQDKLKTFDTHLIPKKGYYIPAEVRRMIGQLGTVPHIEKFFPSDYRQTRHFHHSNLVKVRLLLEKIFEPYNAKFKTENQIRKVEKRSSVVDGILVYEKDRTLKKMGVEVELTLKNSTARRRKVKKLLVGELKNLDNIIIFYSIEVIKARLKADIRNYIEPGVPIFFIQIEDFFKNRKEVVASDLGLADNKRQIFKGL